MFRELRRDKLEMSEAAPQWEGDCKRHKTGPDVQLGYKICSGSQPDVVFLMSVKMRKQVNGWI